MKKYVVTIRNHFIRDAQVYLGPAGNDDYDDDDLNWKDFHPNHFVGIFDADDEDEAINKVSKNYDYPSEILEASEVKFG